MTDTGLIIAAVTLGAFWSLLRGRLDRFAQPLRLRLARNGHALLADARLPEGVAVEVRGLLASCFSSVPLLVVALCLPVAAALRLFRRGRKPLWHDLPEDLRQNLNQLYADYWMSIYCANPLLAPLVSIEIAAIVVVFALVGITSGAVEDLERQVLRMDGKVASRISAMAPQSSN